jgi:DNA-binding NarL/FixJ family response regulator
MSQRSNNAWTEEEETVLTSMTSSGASYVRIAAKLERSISAVRAHHFVMKCRQVSADSQPENKTNK